MRSGKIALLPHHIREQLNLRLRNNNRPASILAWLNALPETKALLNAEFQGRPLTKQNLSDWRHGGFRDWLLRQEASFSLIPWTPLPRHNPTPIPPTSPNSSAGSSFS